LNKNIVDYNKPYYLLMKETRDLCDTDPRWEFIDSIPEIKFFESNSLLNLEQKLP